MKDTIILLTGIYRFDNLKTIAKSVNKYYKMWNNVYNIYWVICKDQYNGFGNIEDAENYIKNTDIQYEIIDSGKPNQKNYGGALFNEPLISFVSKHNLDNPWVYVLDDDNIIHPNMFSAIYMCDSLKKLINVDRSCIVLTIKFDEGYTKLINITTHNVGSPKYNFIDGTNIVDPSAVALRYDIISKYGMYDEVFSYDYGWLLTLLEQEKNKNNIWYYNNYFFGQYITAYHNHATPLINTDKIDYFKSLDVNDVNIDINLSKILSKQDIDDFLTLQNASMVQQNNIITDIPILSNKSKQQILNIIYNEIQTIKNQDEI